MRVLLKALPFALLSLWSSTAPAAAQSVADVVEDMYAAFERQVEGVQNYTLVQNVMGFVTTSYYVKETVDGRPVFRLEEEDWRQFAWMPPRLEAR